MSLKALTLRSGEGSHATQACRFQGLQAIADDLKAMGIRLPEARSLKPAHVTRLVAHWKRSGIKDATIRNRLGWVRWWAEKIGKASVVPSTNDTFGLAARTPYQGNKARRLTPEILAKVKDERIRLALRLEAAFGLRREEALKFQPKACDRGGYLALIPSTTKGGRYREIRVVHERQRVLLDEVAAVAGDGSLVPDTSSYVDYLQRYKHQTRAAGLGQAHGLRHAWAQWMFKRLTGWACPAAGGPTVEAMTRQQQRRDYWARMEISRELGHNRIDVTDTYLGRRHGGADRAGKAA